MLKKYSGSLIWLILVLSLLLHILFFIKNPGWIFQESNTGVISKYGATDAYNYSLTAELLIEEKMFAFVYLERPENPQPGAYITPAQPIFIIFLIFLGKLLNIDFVYLGIFFNLVMSMATAYLLYKICLELFNNRWIGLLSALIYTLYFSPYHYFRTLLTEIPSIFLLCLSILLFIKAWKYNKKKYHILFGIIFSILLMFRPNPAPLVLIAIVIVLRTFGVKESLKIGLYWIIGPILFIFPWVIRNAIVLDQFILFSTQSGNPLLAGTDAFNKEGFDAVFEEMKRRGYTDEKEYALVRIKEGLSNDFTYWFSWLTLGKFIELFRYPSGLSFYTEYGFYRYMQYAHSLLVSTGIISSVLSLINYSKNKKIALLVCMFFVYCGFSIIFLAIDRYGFFIIPVLTIIASFGIYSYILEPLHKVFLRIRKKVIT